MHVVLMCVTPLKNDESTLYSICHHRLVVRTGRCGRPDGGSILPGDIFLIYLRFNKVKLETSIFDNVEKCNF